MGQLDNRKLLIFQKVFMAMYMCMLFFIDMLQLYSLVVVALLAIVSIIYVIADYINGSGSFKNYKIDLLVLFILVNGISSIINFKYGFMENILCLYTLFIDYFIFYNIGGNRSEIQVHQTFYAFSHILILIYTALSTFSLISYALSHSHSFYTENLYLRQGFMDNRLFGIFNDPNYAAISCFVVIIICCYYAIKSKDKLLSGFYYLFAFINLCYMILSGSRTAMLSFIGAVLIGGYFFCYKIFQNKFNHIITQIVCIGLSLAISGALVTGFNSLGKGLTYVPTVVDYLQGEDIKKMVPVSIVREDVAEGKDLTNNRVNIWSGAFELFRQKPLFGTSPRNMIAYAEKLFPANYIAIRKYMVHNSLFETLVLSGMLGFAVMCIFLGSCAYRAFKHLFSKTDDHFAEVIMGLMIIVGLLASSMTLSMLFYKRGFYNIIFWVALGYLTYFTCPKKESKTLIVVNKLLRRKPSGDEITIKGDTNGR